MTQGALNELANLTATMDVVTCKQQEKVWKMILGNTKIMVEACAADERASASLEVRPTPLKNGGDHSFGGRFGPLRNRPPVLWYHFLESWRRDGENREKTRKNGARMGEIWPKKKSAGRRPICDG